MLHRDFMPAECLVSLTVSANIYSIKHTDGKAIQNLARCTCSWVEIVSKDWSHLVFPRGYTQKI